MKKLFGTIWFFILTLIALIIILLTLISTKMPNNIYERFSNIITNFYIFIDKLDKKLSKYYE